MLRVGIGDVPGTVLPGPFPDWRGVELVCSLSVFKLNWMCDTAWLFLNGKT